MQKAKNILYLFLFAFLLLIQLHSILSVPTVSAESLWDKQIGMNDSKVGSAFNEGTTATDIREVVARVIKIFLTLLGIIFLVLIIYAGFRWMTAGGNESTVGEAKSQLINAFIGLVIITMAYAITSFVTTCVFELSSGSNIWQCQ